MECWYCGEIGHLKAESYKRKRETFKEDAEKDRFDNAIVDLLQKDELPKDWALTTSHTPT